MPDGITLSGARRRVYFAFFFSSRRRHTRFDCDWSSDVCSSDLLAARLVGLDLPLRHLEPVRRVPEEDHAQHRHEVVARGELGVGAEVVRGLPEGGLELLKILVGAAGHAGPLEGSVPSLLYPPPAGRIAGTEVLRDSAAQASRSLSS